MGQQNEDKVLVRFCTSIYFAIVSLQLKLLVTYRNRFEIVDIMLSPNVSLTLCQTRTSAQQHVDEKGRTSWGLA